MIFPSCYLNHSLCDYFCLVSFFLSTGLESGSVTLKEPSSEEGIESSAPVTLHCQIDGHPRWVSYLLHFSPQGKGLNYGLYTKPVPLS